jgi:hypothetical protein
MCSCSSPLMWACHTAHIFFSPSLVSLLHCFVSLSLSLSSLSVSIHSSSVCLVHSWTLARRHVYASCFCDCASPGSLAPPRPPKNRTMFSSFKKDPRVVAPWMSKRTDSMVRLLFFLLFFSFSFFFARFVLVQVFVFLFSCFFVFVFFVVIISNSRGILGCRSPMELTHQTHVST